MVEKIFFSSPSWSAGLLTPEHPMERARKFRIKGFLNPGDNVILSGIWVKDNNYGEQLDVAKLEYNHELSKEGLIKYLAHNPIIKNIGIKRARTIVEFFGANGFEDALNEAPEYMAKVAKVGIEDIKNLQTEWNNTKHLNNALAQLADWDLTNHQIKTLIDKLGTSAISLLKANPYLLIDNLDGFGFSKVDKIAQKIGVSKYLPTRIQAGIQYTLGQQLQSGSTWVLQNSLLDEANRILNLDSLDSFQLIESELNELITQNKVCKFNHGSLTGEFLVAIPNVHHIESTIANKLINCQRAKLDKETVAHTLETTFSKRTNGLHPKQKEAVIKVFTSNLSLISGGGGTGKTHCIGLIADLAEHYNMTVAICAPTGKAAKRITEATNWDAITIHRLLEYDGFNWGRNSRNLLSYDLIIIDESSMIDSLLLYRLFDAILLSDTSVVFVGDHNQLPPVGWGNPLRDLITTQIIPTTILDKVVRQDLILKDNTLDILKGKVAPTANTPGVRPWYLVDKFKEEDQIIDFLVDLYANTLEEKLNFNILYDVQVLTSRHDTPLGTINLNLVLQKLIQKKLYNNTIDNPLPAKGQPVLYIGDKVIQIRNNYKCGREQLEIMNGSIGIVREIYTAYDENDKPTEYIQITFDCGIVTIKSKSSEREDLHLAYVLTPHKYQGSEIPCAIVICHKSHSFQHHRNWLYTAVSRAKETCIILGDRWGINNCATTTSTDRRNTFLSFMTNWYELENLNENKKGRLF